MKNIEDVKQVKPAPSDAAHTMISAQNLSCLLRQIRSANDGISGAIYTLHRPPLRETSTFNKLLDIQNGLEELLNSIQPSVLP